METKILKVDPLNPEDDLIDIAVGILKNKDLVAFPTETVYGLGADIENENAIKKIFTAKNRPSDNPLIAHIGKMEDVEKIALDIPSTGRVLMEVFWPGPLTIVLKKKENIGFFN